MSSDQHPCGGSGPSLIGTIRRTLNGDSVPSSEAEQVEAMTADTQAWTAIRLAEERLGRRLAEYEIRRQAEDTLRFALALDKIGEERGVADRAASGATPLLDGAMSVTVTGDDVLSMLRAQRLG